MDSLLQTEDRAAFEAQFEKLFPLPDSFGVVDSPCGRYELEMTRFAEYPPELTQTTFLKKRGEPDCSRDIVREKETGRVIAGSRRIRCSFWSEWVDHPNGDQYLLCAEDAAGYSVVNLTSAKTHQYRPSASDRDSSLLWCHVYPSPDKTRLAVFDARFYDSAACALLDFRSPDSLPYPELARGPGNNDIEALGLDDDQRKGWRDNETFVYRTQRYYRKTDGSPIDFLVEQESDGRKIGVRAERVILQPGREPKVEFVSDQ
jgi:hypothetical protein